MKKVDIFFIHFLFFIKIYKKELFILFQGIFYFADCKRNNPSTGKKERIEPISKDKVDEVLARYGVKLENNVLYDYVYWANQCKADIFKSSVPDEAHLALYIKDMTDDPDAPDGMAMCMWYAKMNRAGEPIEWDEML